MMNHLAHSGQPSQLEGPEQVVASLGNQSLHEQLIPQHISWADLLNAVQMGQLLRNLRERHGWRQSDIAQKIGYSTSQINRIENGKRQLNPNLVTSQLIQGLFVLPDANRPSMDRPYADVSWMNVLSFGTLLRVLRLRCGISQCNFAQQVGYSASQINRIEKGKRRVHPDVVRKLFVPVLAQCGDSEALALLQHMAVYLNKGVCKN